MLIGIPDEAAQRNLFAMEVPRLGSFIASGTWDSREVGLETFPPEDRPPVVIPFFELSRDGRHGPDHAGGLLVRTCSALARPPGDHALVPVGGVPVFPHRLHRRAAGWFTAEVGRQPWVVYGLLRTKDAVTPSLVTADVVFSLLAYIRSMR